MKTRKLFCIAVLASVLAGCYYVPPGSGALTSMSVVMKQPASPLTSAVLAVTGPSMTTIVQNVDPVIAPITVEVPAGPDRTFTLLINTVSTTFRGEDTVDLDPETETTVTLYPELFATQIIVPDYNNERVVQISDMTGAGWTAVNGSDMSGMPSTFHPSDIDFDSQGRIYISNAFYEADGPQLVIRMDDINDKDVTNDVLVEFDLMSGVPAIAVDRTNDYVYYADSVGAAPPMIYRKKIEPLGSQEGPADVAALDPAISGLSFTGMAVDDAGIVYMTSSFDPAVLKVSFTPGVDLVLVPEILAKYVDPALVYPTDVIAKNGLVYVINRNAADGYTILEFDENLNLTNHFGNQVSAAITNPGDFQGPLAFAAALNAEFYVLDQYNPEVPETARLVSFNGMSPSGWISYGSLGSGVGEFVFEGNIEIPQ